MTVIDMLNDANDMMNMYQRMMQNPKQFLSQRYNIPQNINDPNEILQHLLNSGQVSQMQVNRAMNLRNNPIIQMLMNK